MSGQKNLILFDDKNRDNLLPMTYTRPAAEIRIGITTISEKWQSCFNASCSFLTVDYLNKKYPLQLSDDNFFINSCLIPDKNLTNAIDKMNSGDTLRKGDMILAYRGASPDGIENAKEDNKTGIEYSNEVLCIQNPWDIFALNGEVLIDDFQHITNGRTSQPLSNTNTVIGKHPVFLEDGAKAECCIFNTTPGPIYIGRNAEVMEGSIVRGPFALCEDSTLKFGTKIYGPTTIGPHCKVGGEIVNSVFFSYSNKAHDGFLGNSVVGEWCNLGAGTNNSNLKNNYALVKLWSYRKNRFTQTGLQFCGLIMGDHSKCGINTMFNTGTVVGVGANIYGPGFPRNFIPSFSWGGSGGLTLYKIEKALETASIVMQRRNLTLSGEEAEILSYLYDYTKKYRKES